MQPFDSYNARFVDPSTIAETFVLRKREFSSLCEQNNSLLIGPRGSGKTTLLKMLKVSAQVSWKNKRQSKFLRRFTFAPIYVGADRLFDFVMGSLKQPASNQRSLELIGKCLLSFRIKFGCLDTAKEISDPKLPDMEHLSHQFERLDLRSEVELSKQLSTAWALDDSAMSLLEIRSQLRAQLGEVNRFVDKMKYGAGVSPDELIASSQFITHDPIYVCQAFVDIFNLTIGKPDKIWALCIDEIEIMPAFLQMYLFSCFRSIDHRIVLQIATSPFACID